MIIKLIRMLLPTRIRQNVGLKVLAIAGQSWTIGHIVFWLLTGKFPTGIWMTSKTDCAYRYKNRKITAPRDGILAFLEVFHNAVYEQHWRPREGDRVVDVGAYAGMFTVKMSQDVGESGMVLAFEPAPSNLKYLVGNIWERKNVMVFPIALSDHDGEGTLHISDASPCHVLDNCHDSAVTTKETVKVSVMTLDKLLSDKGVWKVDFIKIDAEGAELAILRGAEQTLRRGCSVAVATYHEKEEAALVAGYLTDLGYSVISEKDYVYACPFCNNIGADNK